MAQPGEPYTSLNRPEENDETRSQEFESEHLHNTNNHFMNRQRTTEEQKIIPQHDTFSHDHLSAAYTHPTSYTGWHEPHRNDWQYSSMGQRDGSPHSLPSCLPSAVYQTISEGSLFYPSRPHSLPGSCSPSLISLEHPQSLHSFVPSAHFYPHGSSSYTGPYQHPQCCHQFGQPHHHCNSRPGHQQAYRPSGPGHYRQMDLHTPERSNVSPNPKRDLLNTTHLSQEQRKVFVTYEADSEEHLKEIIKFVALLRNNGFDTHIDVFEEQLSSISKIDCMERYLNQKDYLIIIIISLKYYKTVTHINISGDDDEKTSNTVYIHRQLQSEFIQNGCRNYRVIPVLFPGANKSYVPTWLRNTHIYSWPKDRDDILRRLMRLEKYSPPPIGPLPTIVSIPL
ncbi:uncharacterized protein traf3ip2b isoform X1 [Paramisgurnus dabryanus]|uniref:uncharacterized protein traf3ip2b isoform X1 n=1 Tax=Paramisgurnus dabryanus TaxID=90735 RepID=UPI0031F3D727